jgi:hypothetical protein
LTGELDPYPIEKVIAEEVLDSLMPIEKSDPFVEALYGNASEGAYDIRLNLSGPPVGASWHST